MSEHMNKTKTSIGFLAASLVVAIFYSYFLSKTDRGLPIDDPFSIGLVVVWSLIIIWVGYDLYKGKKHAKTTLLIIAVIVLVLGIQDFMDDPIYMPVVLSGVSETILLFCAYYFAPKNTEMENSN